MLGLYVGAMQVGPRDGVYTTLMYPCFIVSHRAMVWQKSVIAGVSNFHRQPIVKHFPQDDPPLSIDLRSVTASSDQPLCVRSIQNTATDAVANASP